MKKIALIKDGVVQNIAIWDGKDPWNPEGFLSIDVTDVYCGVGFIYVDGVFIQPPEQQ